MRHGPMRCDDPRRHSDLTRIRVRQSVLVRQLLIRPLKRRTRRRCATVRCAATTRVATAISLAFVSVNPQRKGAHAARHVFYDGRRYGERRQRLTRASSHGLPVSVMILPQVHLREPCYDFYFL